LFGVSWKDSSVPLDQGLCGAVQIAGPAVISQPFPELENIVLVGSSEICDRGETGEESLEVRDDGNNRRLLQHDLADPDLVRIARLPPRQRTSDAPVPRSQSTVQP
jgi:hypothetical protein